MKKTAEKFSVQIAKIEHLQFADELCKMYEESAKKRGTGIAKRDPEYIKEKIIQEKAIIAISAHQQIAGFCYIETWEGKNYVANSGLIVKEDFRHHGLAKRIKKFVFEHTRKKFPNAKIFGITTSLAVMKLNSDLGYKPVTFSELTQDDAFWSGCKSCINYDVLTRTERKNCLCTAMLFNPKDEKKKEFAKIKKIEKKIPSKLKTPKAQRIRVVKTAGKSKENKK
ncbi:MAG TPA: GNAT family N-acetyltransferase [Chitinophagales bacterium]|nr:GNAT family N-acetyltransferase [Chitinophagales bacterium]MBP6153692.1 GNAT family N-acetyltransferase [Chitinophagales bacterium]HQV79060.1 GNAT family N-acetyltransferase [Chitinophagales bacterium]HQW79817.1 GNAT family N-acetyltransferase [Chitinophagales bacterium]HRB19089.1 GNAT family N-acetyltransferase [Chitinophagales bacterium]